MLTELKQKASPRRNRDEFLRVWEATRFLGYAESGDKMELPHGVFPCDPIRVDTPHGDAPIEGTATFRLTRDCDVPFFDWPVWGVFKETWARGFTLNGDNHTVPELWHLRSGYNIGLSEIHLINAKGDGLRVQGAGEVTLQRVQGDSLTGFALTLDDCLHAAVRDCTGEQCEGTLRVIGNPARSFVAGIAVDGLYGERARIGILLENHVTNFSARNLFFSGEELFRIRKGCYGNQIDVTHCRGHGFIEKGCWGNTIRYDSMATQIHDDDGRNHLIPDTNRWLIVGDAPSRGTLVASHDGREGRRIDASIRPQLEPGEYVLRWQARTLQGTPYGDIQIMDVQQPKNQRDEYVMYDFNEQQFIRSRGTGLTWPLERTWNQYELTPFTLTERRQLGISVRAAGEETGADIQVSDVELWKI